MSIDQNKQLNTDSAKPISWYPGHMTKAVRNMKSDIRLIDLVIEIIDARAPISSRNPDIDRLAQGKFRLVILNKADLADSAVTEEWIRYFKDRNICAAAIDARSNSRLKSVNDSIARIMKEKRERDRARGILNRPTRALICGIPNVGKSTFINSLAGRASAKTGNKPGVTKGNQWISLKNGIDLLDTPGILWPRFNDARTGINLALLGSISDNVIDLEEIACECIKTMTALYPGALFAKYSVDESAAPYEVLCELARNRSLLKSGGDTDTLRAARLLLDDLRSSKIIRFTLERPE